MERVPQYGKRSGNKESVPRGKEIVPQLGNSEIPDMKNQVKKLLMLNDF